MPIRVLQRLEAAMNARDIDAFVDCFHDDYDSEQPNHPDRTFQGSEQVRANWSAVFTGVPDFSSRLVRGAADGDTCWGEWHWQGTQADGTPMEMAGVMICGIRDERIGWARLYMEPVEQGGAGIEAAVREISGGE